MTKIASRRAILRTLASGPTGTTGRDASSAIGLSVNAVMDCLRSMADDGELVRVDERARARFFVTRAAAESFRRLSAQSTAQKAKAHTAKQRAWWPKDAEPVITAKTKITIAPPAPTPLVTNTHARRWG